MADAELRHAVGLYEQFPAEDQWRWKDWVADAAEGKPSMELVNTVKAKLLQEVCSEPWVELMRAGLQHYKKGDLERATDLFFQADSADAACVSVVLNLAQVTIERKFLAENNVSLQQWVACLACLNRLHFGALSLKQQKRYKTLMQRYSAIYTRA